ncbi:glycoside hydrolase superfamily [Endogone sp. FLAS-F59071]|nr:glycoside hydrolase superfamily [Endogone sp. FLAS-F59071]|eukprot:RUS17542.1 glycoside hydrolase superfamily [Endogone sp. FLAS-F59071]
MRSLLATVSLLAIAALEASAAGKVNVGYFPNWLYAKYPVSNIPFSKYTHINYAFAIVNDASGTPTWSDPSEVQTQLPQLVTAAHAAGTKVLISAGGWSGCIAYSAIAGSSAARTTFINWSVAQIKTYNTDGVDIDWEYPGKQGAGCNTVDVANDTPNFLELLKELRAALDSSFPGANKEISLANRAVPFETPSGPSTDVSAFVPYVDRFQLMLYDMNGAWNSTTGPNAPFKQTTGVGAPFSYTDGIDLWMAAGVPASKIVAGLAFYGHTIKANEDMTKTGSQFQACTIGAPLGDSDDAYWQDPYCSKDPGGYGGIWKWTNLRSQGLLTTPTTAAAPWVRYFDETSQTPWLFNPTTSIFISYDDPVSLKVKVDYALCKGLGGVMVWDIHQDNGELLDVVVGIQGSAPSDCGSTPGTTPGTNPGTAPGTTPGTTTTAKPPKTTTMTNTMTITPAKKATTTTTAAPMSTSAPPMTTSAPPTTTGTSGQGSCSNSNMGQMVCTSPNSGLNYNQCINGSWVSRQCGPGTVCLQSDANNIQCGFPQ